MGIMDSIFGGGSQETKAQLPDYIKNPAHSMGSFLNEIFDREKKAYKNTGGFNQTQLDALGGIEGLARSGTNQLGQQSSIFLSDLLGNDGLTRPQEQLANQLISGQFDNPAMAGAGYLASGGASNPAWGNVNAVASGALNNRNPALAGYDEIARTGGGVNPAMGGYGEIARTGGGVNPAMAGTQAIARGSFAGMNPAMGETARIAMGGGVGTNPFLEGTFRRAADVMGDNFRENVIGGMDRAHAAQGRLGSNAYANARNKAEDAYGRSVNDLAQQVFGGAYEGDQSRRMGALGQLGQLGQFDQSMIFNALGQQGQLGQQQVQNQLAGLQGQGQLGQQQVQNRLAGLQGQGQLGEAGLGRQMQGIGLQSQLGQQNIDNMLAGIGLQGQLHQQNVGNRMAGSEIFGQGIQNNMGASQLSPMIQQARYGDLDRLFGVGQTRMEGPYQQLMNAGRAVQMLPYGQGSVQTSQMNPFSQAIGLGSSALGMGLMGSALFSDRRLKRDVVRVGATPGGVPLYRYKYLWSDQEHIGVMADEAPPEAVSRVLGDFAVVDYAKVR